VEKKLSIESVKNNLIGDINKALQNTEDKNDIDVLHIMKDLVKNNLKEIKRGIMNKSIKNYFDDLNE